MTAMAQRLLVASACLALIGCGRTEPPNEHYPHVDPDDPSVDERKAVLERLDRGELTIAAAARELGVNPERTWYVGDSVWDMQAARAAAMRAVGVATGAASVKDLEDSGASLTVKDLGEVVALLAPRAAG